VYRNFALIKEAIECGIEKNQKTIGGLMKNYVWICLVLLLCSCAVEPPPVVPVQTTAIEGDKYWTLDFFYFYKGKQTHTKAFQFVSRRDCFDTLYQMQVDSKKVPHHSGSGICMKQFVEGQKRTENDVLGYR
jgi:hypothetical protein